MIHVLTSLAGTMATDLLIKSENITERLKKGRIEWSIKTVSNKIAACVSIT